MPKSGRILREDISIRAGTINRSGGGEGEEMGDPPMGTIFK